MPDAPDNKPLVHRRGPDGQMQVGPWIEADKEVRELLGRRDTILARAATGPAPSVHARRRDRLALEELAVRINAAIARVNAGAPTDRQRRRSLVVADEIARYDEACRR